MKALFFGLEFSDVFSRIDADTEFGYSGDKEEEDDDERGDMTSPVRLVECDDEEGGDITSPVRLVECDDERGNMTSPVRLVELLLLLLVMSICDVLRDSLMPFRTLSTNPFLFVCLSEL